MANLYLLRHGKVAGEAALYGHTDVEVFRQTNQEIVDAFIEQNIPVNCLYSSPLKRCASLAQSISEQVSCKVELLSGLKEMNFGQYDGISFDDLYQDKEVWSQLERFWQNPVQHPLPQAELLTGFSYRVNGAWQSIIEKVNVSDANENVLVVCHGGVIRMILAHLLNVDFRNPLWYTQLAIANGSVTSIEINQKNTRIKGIAKPLLACDSPSFEDTANKNLNAESIKQQGFPESLLTLPPIDNFLESI